MRNLLLSFLFVCASVTAAPITDISINGTPGGGPVVFWDSPIGNPWADVWLQVAGPTYVPYATNQIDATGTGTVSLRLEGFGGFGALNTYATGLATGYQLNVTLGAATYSLTCTVSGANCSGSGTSSSGGYTLSGFSIAEAQDNLVAAFANAALPGTSTNVSDLTASFTFTADNGGTNTVPEPASIALMGAGLVALGLLRRKH